MPITTCVFDAYGTLFDVSAAARLAAAEPAFERIAERWMDIAKDWRDKQLQYTWLRAVTGDHADFWDLTGDGLDWALEKNGFAGDTALRDRLMALYWELQAYPEVPEMLQALKEKGLATGILSNGSPDMLAGAAQSAGITRHLDHILSVESVGIFKPAAAVYDMVGAAFGVERDEVLFVSSNGWDAWAATAYGFDTVWVNRAGDPVDRLTVAPKRILEDLTTIAEIACA